MKNKAVELMVAHQYCVGPEKVKADFLHSMPNSEGHYEYTFRVSISKVNQYITQEVSVCSYRKEVHEV